MDEAYGEETRHREEVGVEQPAHKTHQRPKGHDRHPPHGVGNFAAEGARNTRREGKERNDQPRVFAPAQPGQVRWQFGDHHGKTGRKQKITGAQQHKRHRVERWRRG